MEVFDPAFTRILTESALKSSFGCWPSLYCLGADRIENTAPSIVVSVSIAVDTCLPCRCQAVTAPVRSNVPAFSRHVTAPNNCKCYFQDWTKVKIKKFCCIMVRLWYAICIHCWKVSLWLNETGVVLGGKKQPELGEKRVTRVYMLKSAVWVVYI
jgi:hypothetical protein